MMYNNIIIFIDLGFGQTIIYNRKIKRNETHFLFNGPGAIINCLQERETR